MPQRLPGHSWDFSQCAVLGVYKFASREPQARITHFELKRFCWLWLQACILPLCFFWLLISTMEKIFSLKHKLLPLSPHIFFLLLLLFPHILLNKFLKNCYNSSNIHKIKIHYFSLKNILLRVYTIETIYLSLNYQFLTKYFRSTCCYWINIRRHFQ